MTFRQQSGDALDSNSPPYIVLTAVLTMSLLLSILLGILRVAYESPTSARYPTSLLLICRVCDL